MFYLMFHRFVVPRDGMLACRPPLLPLVRLRSKPGVQAGLPFLCSEFLLRLPHPPEPLALHLSSHAESPTLLPPPHRHHQ